MGQHPIEVEQLRGRHLCQGDRRIRRAWKNLEQVVEADHIEDFGHARAHITQRHIPAARLSLPSRPQQSPQTAAGNVSDTGEIDDQPDMSGSEMLVDNRFERRNRDRIQPPLRRNAIDLISQRFLNNVHIGFPAKAFANHETRLASAY